MKEAILDLKNKTLSLFLVPWLPAASILTNVFLTTKLSVETWVRFSVWMGAGLLMYGLYGWRNSSGKEGRLYHPSFFDVFSIECEAKILVNVYAAFSHL